MAGEEHRGCPLIASRAATDRADFVCAWTSPLKLDVEAKSARFAFSVRVYAERALELPGDTQAWPVAVLANNLPIAVIEQNGRPSIRLSAGNYAISGELAFATRPERLALAQLFAIVELNLDGKRATRIRREDGMLWLGQLEREATLADALSIEVFRRIEDELPLLQTLALKVDVAGRAREVSFDAVLGPDFVPLRVRSALPAQVNERGDLKVKLEPGSFFIYLDGRATTMTPKLAPSKRAAPWPAEEIFSYASNPRIRVSQARAPRPIDANTLDMPQEWKALPAFVVSPDEALTIEESARGRLSDARNELTLQRTAWLRFDGSEWRFRDQLSGRMTRDFRVDLNAPLKLLSARINEEDRLITEGANAGQRGVEIREDMLNLSADSSLTGGAATLPVGAWAQSLEQANWTLNLPPSYRLLHASGASYAPGTWLERFSLLDIFLVLLALVLLRRALGWSVMVAGLVFFTIAYHNHSGLTLLLATLSALHLAAVKLPDNLLKRVVVVSRWVLLALLSINVLVFAAEQVRLALYPQLEAGAMSYGERGVDSSLIASSPPPPPSPPAPMEMTSNMAADASSEPNVALQKNSNSANSLQALSKSRNRLNRYAQDVVVQAGVGMPNWQWQGYTMSFQGPLSADQTVRLWISPAWATRLGRLLAIFGLGFVLFAFGRALKLKVDLRAAAPLLLTLCCLPTLSSTANAQATPSAELLAELKARLTQPPTCAPVCADLAVLEISADAASVSMVLELHTQSLSAVPLPEFADGWQPSALDVDGVEMSFLARDAQGLSYVGLSPGVHRVRLSGPLSGMDRFKLSLPLKPRSLKLSISGWSALGLRDGVLLSANLELVRERQAGASADSSPSASADRLLPFVRVTRRFDFASDFSIETTVTRVAPAGESLNLTLPLLSGEQVLSSEVAVGNGVIQIALPGDREELSFNSKLERSARLQLKAGDFSQRAETWILAPGDEWRVSFNGTPALEAQDPAQAFVYEFRPRPGEELDIALSRPRALPGATLALDEISLTSKIGAKAQDHELRLDYRATRSQQHVIGLPAGLELLSFISDGQVLPIRPQDGKLSLPITPGAHSVQLNFREARAVSLQTSTPAFNLNLPSANILIKMNPPGARWTVFASGPKLGVAVLYWGELLFALLLAVVISRLRLTPLGTGQWLLLVLGFSTWSWLSLILVVVWLHALSLRPRYVQRLSDGTYNFLQVILGLLTALALAAIVLSVPLGLLGDPDMHIAGFGSSASEFRWFADASSGVLPVAMILSVPKWIYQLLMLSFALWLAVSLSSWLRWGYHAYAEHGLWRQHKPSESPPLPKGAAERTEAIGTVGTTNPPEAQPPK